MYNCVEVVNSFRRSGLPLSYSRFWMETPLNPFKITALYPYFPYFKGNRLDIVRMNRDLNLNNIPYRSEIVMGPTQPGSSKMEILVAPTVARLLQLQVIPDDSKRTLDNYLNKLERAIDRIRDHSTRVPFAIAHTVIDTQLKRLTGIEKAIRDTVAPRLTYGSVVNNLPPANNHIPTTGNPIAGEIDESPSNSPFHEVNSPVHSDFTDNDMDRQGPDGLGGNL